jgi:hypothetical protein
VHPPCKLAVLTLATLALATAGCDDDEPANPGPEPSEEGSDRPAKPPRGWQVVRNRRAGFTVSVPRTWTARKRGTAMLIRSDDRLVSITGVADRTAEERTRSPETFARQTIRHLPGFKGRIGRRARKVRAPYRTARVDAVGKLRTSRVRQRITAAVYQRPGFVTYELLVFRNARVLPRFNDPVVERLLRSFRAQAPDFTP